MLLQVLLACGLIAEGGLLAAFIAVFFYCIIFE